jgi:hypothetical protein
MRKCIRSATLLLLLSSYVVPHVTANASFRSFDGSLARSSVAHRSRRSRRSASSSTPLSFLDEDVTETRLCNNGVAKNLLRGACLRVASDLSGGTVLESIKTRVTISGENMFQATRNIVQEGGVLALWAGTPTRTVEGALIGGLFLVGSAFTKSQLIKLGVPPTLAALSGGVIGGIAQSVAMTPAGMIFTALHANKGKPGHENDNAVSITRRIVREKGFFGLYAGNTPMVIRQASNWASRAGFTEIARTTLGMSKYGLLGEIGSGVIGGVGSCWNTPIETIRVTCQRDINRGKSAKSMGEYWNAIRDEEGYAGLFRGVSPRAIQAVWQTCFLVVVPNLMGI